MTSAHAPCQSNKSLKQSQCILIERGFKQEEQRSTDAEIRFAKFAPELQMTLILTSEISGRLGNGFMLTSLRDTLNPLLLGNFSRRDDRLSEIDCTVHRDQEYENISIEEEVCNLRVSALFLIAMFMKRWHLTVHQDMKFPLYRLVFNSAENIPMFQCHTLSDIRKLLRCASLRYNAPFSIPQSKLIDFKEKETFSGSMSRKSFAINPLSSNKRPRKKRVGSKSKDSDNNLTVNKIVRGNRQPLITHPAMSLVENNVYNRFMHQDTHLYIWYTNTFCCDSCGSCHGTSMMCTLHAQRSTIAHCEANGLCQELQNRTEATTPLSAKTGNI
ncbi:hypothetical protein G5I_14832 [Acromyrmex echinatior]|uniref:Uncharacterized protein n=1 Tax=Acromyrmex echinatior TaxID=103372 RepID=F4X8U2_ACREC|nr:hypothetical protein G5I_14832 [Acromyrmex echinatior]